MVKVIRRSNMFEHLLLVVGIAVVAFGVFLITKMQQSSGKFMSPDIIIAILLWLLLIFTLINTAINENLREEVGVIMHTNSQEIKLLRHIATEQVHEIRLLRQAVVDTKSKNKK